MCVLRDWHACGQRDGGGGRADRPRLALPARDVWGVCHADMRGDARVKAVLAWGAEALRG
ncbi:hypothetical protein [Sorangium sp. So ce1389]|uniref:hypothetical protein n=1 Tax=Sorangium sp. So ce1389 TaxID=3133336 RepID=UPI003F624462